MSDIRLFRTPFQAHDRVKAVSGVPDKTNYVGRFDDRGRVVLTPNGKTNMYEFIQSHADSVDINVLLARFKNGDVEALSKAQGVYADISDMPKTFADMLNKVMAAEETFNSLDVDVRAKFNHNLNEFLASAGTEEWCNKMGIDFVKPVPKKKSTKKVADVPSVPEEVPALEGES